MNNMGSSNSVVRMDMKMLISEDIKLAAISYTFAATQTLSSEYIKGTVSNTINNHYGSNIVDNSGILFSLRLSLLILNSPCEEGARGVNNIWVISLIIGRLILVS